LQLASVTVLSPRHSSFLKWVVRCSVPLWLAVSINSVFAGIFQSFQTAHMRQVLNVGIGWKVDQVKKGVLPIQQSECST